MCWSDPGKLRSPLNNLQRLLSALMIHEGDLQTHTHWPQPSLGWLLPFDFGQGSHFLHNGLSLPTCPACMPRLPVVIAGLGPRGCIQYPTYSEAPAGPCSQHVQPSFLSGEITLWNLTFLCLLTGPVEQWSPWDHRKHMFAIKSLWDPHGPRMSNKLSFLFYFFFSMGIGVCFCQMTF